MRCAWGRAGVARGCAWGSGVGRQAHGELPALRHPAARLQPGGTEPACEAWVKGQVWGAGHGGGLLPLLLLGGSLPRGVPQPAMGVRGLAGGCGQPDPEFWYVRGEPGAPRVGWAPVAARRGAFSEAATP